MKVLRRVLFCGVAILGVLCVLPFVSRMNYERGLREIGADHRSVSTRLLVIRIALDTYPRIHGCLPPSVVVNSNGDPLYSWRVALGTLVEEGNRKGWLDFRRNEDWRAPSQKGLREYGGSMGFGYRTDSSAKFLGITGAGTAFDTEKFCKLSDMPAGLIVIVEKCDSDIFWMEPGDLKIEQLRQSTDQTCQALFANGRRSFHVLFADLQIWELSCDTPLELFIACATAETANAVNRGKLSEYERHF